MARAGQDDTSRPGAPRLGTDAALAILIHGFMRVIRRVPGLRAYFEELGVKPKNRFRRGLFVRGRGRLARGGCLTQAFVRDGRNRYLLSDDALGPKLTLVGFGLDPLHHLAAELRQTWERHGGHTVQFCVRGETLHRGQQGVADRRRVTHQPIAHASAATVSGRPP